MWLKWQHRDGCFLSSQSRRYSRQRIIVSRQRPVTGLRAVVLWKIWIRCWWWLYNALVFQRSTKLLLLQQRGTKQLNGKSKKRKKKKQCRDRSGKKIESTIIGWEMRVYAEHILRSGRDLSMFVQGASRSERFRPLPSLTRKNELEWQTDVVDGPTF